MPIPRTLTTKPWLFTFDGSQVTVARRINWRRQAPVCIRLSEIREAYTTTYDKHNDMNPAFHLLAVSEPAALAGNAGEAVADPSMPPVTGPVREFRGGLGLQTSPGLYFASYINEALCERLRWIFRHTIGLGPHRDGVLRDVPKGILKHWHRPESDLARRLEALRWEGTRLSLPFERHLAKKDIKPADLRTDTKAVLRGAYDSWPFWHLVEHLRGDYEPLDDPAWRGIAEQLCGDRPARSPDTAT